MIYPLQSMDSLPVDHTKKSQTSNKTAPFSMQSGQNDRTSGSMPVWEKTSHVGQNMTADSALNKLQDDQNGSEPVQDEDTSFGFFDFLDIINPLQHIPIVNTIYQNITGDKMGPVAEVLGGALYGGLPGAAVGAVGAIITYETGKSVGDNLVSLFSSSSSDTLSPLEGTTIAMADLTRTRSPYNN